jgi:hypothetical protein
MQTLDELVAAIRDGEVADVMAFVDNDDVTFVSGDETLMRLHPYDVQEQALTLLGIRPEPV